MLAKVRTVMKRYSDVLEFFDALQPLTHFSTLPRNVDEVSLVNDHALRKQLQFGPQFEFRDKSNSKMETRTPQAY
eukprot:5557974-Amphidinium_carterae.2